MINLPLTSEERQAVDAMLKKFQREDERRVRQESSEKMQDYVRRGIYVGGFRISEEISCVAAHQRAKLKAVQEVLSCVHKEWNQNLGAALRRDIACCFHKAHDRILEQIKNGNFGLSNLPPESRSGTIMGAERSLREAQSAILSDLDVLVTQAVAKMNAATSASISNDAHVTTLRLANSTINQINIAGRDLRIINENPQGEKMEEICSYLDKIANILQTDNFVSEIERSHGLNDLDGITRELQIKQPREAVILDHIGRIANIAAVADLAGKLGVLLANFIPL